MDKLAVISEPMRREILRHIWEEELSVSDLVQRFDVTQPAISFHLRVLRDNGLVSVRRDGKQRYYKAIPEEFEDLQEYLKHFWGDRLARLKIEAEIESRHRKRRRE